MLARARSVRGIAARRATHLRGSASVIRAPTQAGDAEGRWYINLIEVWYAILRSADGLRSGVVTMSLCPPPSRYNTVPAVPEEPLWRAMRACASRGLVPVLPVGNWGREDSMSPWARSPHCVAVGAADDAGLSVRPYSSPGSLAGTAKPTVVAPESRPFLPGETGTSFAAYRVGHMAMMVLGFLAELQRSSVVNLDLLPSYLSMVRRCFQRVARPIDGPQHAAGAGFVTEIATYEWLLSLELTTLHGVLPELRYVGNIALSRAKGGLRRGEYVPALENQVRSFGVDTHPLWAQPLFVPGLTPYGSGYLYLQIQAIYRGDYYDSIRQVVGGGTSYFGDVVSSVNGGSENLEFCILPRVRRGRQLVVDPGSQNGYASISDALGAATYWDRIHVTEGDYEERVAMKTGVEMVAEGVVRIRSGPLAPLRGDGVREAVLNGFTFVTGGQGTAALFLHRVDAVLLMGCEFLSERGNAAIAIQANRVVIDNCTLKGAVNGLYAVVTPQLRLQTVTIEGGQIGAILYGVSGMIEGCQLTGRSAEGLWHVPFDGRWTDDSVFEVYWAPMGISRVRSADIGPRIEPVDAGVANLKTILCNLRMADTEVNGGRFGAASASLGNVAEEAASVFGVQGAWAEILSVGAVGYPAGAPPVAALVAEANAHLGSVALRPVR